MDFTASQATDTAERDVVPELLDGVRERDYRLCTLAGDRGYSARIVLRLIDRIRSAIALGANQSVCRIRRTLTCSPLGSGDSPELGQLALPLLATNLCAQGNREHTTEMEMAEHCCASKVIRLPASPWTTRCTGIPTTTAHITNMEISLADWGTIASITVAVIALGTGLFVTGRWVGGVNEHRNTVKDTLAEIREDVKNILKRIPPSTVARESPLHLTDFGQDISEQLDARTWAQRTAAELWDDVEGKQDFEVQEFCFDYVGTQLKPDDEQGRPDWQDRLRTRH